jgi:anti-anti-sigma regulatory factor
MPPSELGGLTRYATTQIDADTVRLVLEGEFADGGPESMAATLIGAIEGSTSNNVEFDLSGVTWLSFEGVGALVRLKQYAEQVGRSLRIIDPSLQAMTMLEQVGLLRWLGFETR